MCFTRRAPANPPAFEVTYIQNNFDPDPEDDTFEGAMVYLIREQGQAFVLY